MHVGEKLCPHLSVELLANDQDPLFKLVDGIESGMHHVAVSVAVKPLHVRLHGSKLAHLLILMFLLVGHEGSVALDSRVCVGRLDHVFVFK